MPDGPGAADPFQKLDATAQAALVESGEASALELAQAAVARVERLNPNLNAVISSRFDKALAEAAAYDAGAKGGAFGGVPYLVKDLDPMSGEPLTMGSRLFRDFKAKKDEPLVEAVRAAGMTILGKTNTPEFGLISTTEPLVHGPTRNPWDPSLSPGGSSGGAAAAVASGMVPIAHATDGGGSIRIPASACGLFGLKPSRGRGLKIDRPSPGNISVGLCVSRSVRDTARFLDVSDAARKARGEDGAPEAIGFVDGRPERPLRIALSLRTATGAAPEPEVAAALTETATLCESLGHKVEEAAPEFDGDAATVHFMALWCSGAAMLKKRFLLIRAVANGWKVWNWPSYEAALDPWTRGLAEMYLAEEAVNPGQLERAAAFIEEVGRVHERFMENYDLTLTPVLRRAHFPIGEQAPNTPFDRLKELVLDNAGYTPLYNAIGWPAMSIPLGWTEAGLPVGAHFGAPRYQEALLLKLAYQLEEAAPWADRWPRVM